MRRYKVLGRYPFTSPSPHPSGIFRFPRMNSQRRDPIFRLCRCSCLSLCRCLPFCLSFCFSFCLPFCLSFCLPLCLSFPKGICVCLCRCLFFPYQTKNASSRPKPHSLIAQCKEETSCISPLPILPSSWQRTFPVKPLSHPNPHEH
jgi:hypothetical protein